MTRNENKNDHPSALANSIRQEELRAEILATWALLLFSSFFVLVYFGSPKGYHNTQPFQAIPWVFSFYVPFVALRLVMAYRKKLRDWHLAVFSAVDPTLISTLLFLWHLQYQQAPSIYLKASTYGGFFVMLSVRALTYRYRYILITGFTAITEWIGLTAYAATTRPDLRTRSFVEYLTQDRILIGAEVEKVLTLITVTAILCVAVYRSRRLLLKAVRETALNQQFSRFFSSDVVEKIRQATETLQPGYGETRHAAILMMDLRGFTKLSEQLPAKEVVKILSEYQARMVTCLFEHGGSVDKFMGDGILAHFGAATDSKTYAADCLRAAFAMIAECRAWNAERMLLNKPVLDFGLSCALGKVVFGIVGDESRMEFTTIGEAVNFTAKLEKHTKELQVTALATKLLLEKAKEQGVNLKGDLRLLPKSAVAGAEKPVDLVVLAEPLSCRLPNAA